jgi:hypothetical protein
MRYEQPTSQNPVQLPGADGKGAQTFTSQLELGTELKTRYHVRSVTDITSCSTCHR